MTLLRRNTILLRSSQQLHRLRLGPFKDILSWQDALQGPSTRLVRCFRNYRDTRTPSGGLIIWQMPNKNGLLGYEIKTLQKEIIQYFLQWGEIKKTGPYVRKWKENILDICEVRQQALVRSMALLIAAQWREQTTQKPTFLILLQMRWIERSGSTWQQCVMLTTSNQIEIFLTS